MFKSDQEVNTVESCSREQSGVSGGIERGIDELLNRRTSGNSVKRASIKYNSAWREKEDIMDNKEKRRRS